MKKLLNLFLLLPLMVFTQELVGPGECGVEAYFEQCEMEYEGCSDLCAEDPDCMSFMIDVNSGGGCCILYNEYATEETILGEEWLDGCCECYNMPGYEEPEPDYEEEEEVITDTLSLYDSWININLHTDNWPQETTWELLDTNQVVIAEGGPYEFQQTLYSEFIELNSGDYYYFLFDSYGDGLWTGGYVEISNSCDSILFYHDGPFIEGATIENFYQDFGYPDNELETNFYISSCAPPLEGCTDELANNYNSEAAVDDGSCEYNYGCNNENASNYDSLAVMLPSGPIVPGGSCNLNVWSQNYFGVDPDFYFGNESTFNVGNKLYIGDNTFWVDDVSEVQGNCNAPAVLVYVVTTPEAADGNIGTYSPGTNVNAVVGEYWYMDPCTFIYGCTEENALNYNPEAGVDDGSCINIPGCTDPNAAGYNPAATLDDESCAGGDIICTENKTLVTVEIMLDQYPSEIGWQIWDNAENLLAEQPQGFYSGQPMGAIVEKQVCINDNTEILFFLSDSYGDGLGGAQWGGIDGTWLVYTECGDTISQGQGNFGALWIDIGTVTPCAPQPVVGCTDNTYLEFNPMANEDDGSCLTERVFGCIDPDAFNYEENANTQLINPDCTNTLKLYDWADNGWSGSFMVVTQGDNWWGPFTLEGDQTEFETDINLNTQDMVKAYFYSFGQSQQTSEQCRFEILNPIGDVVLEGGTNPYTNPVLSYNQYGFSYQGQALCGDNCIPKVYGCLDSEAINYNELANTTSNDCYYNPGCINEAYTEYYTYIDENGVEADFDDGSCNQFAVFGCTIEGNFNFNANATVNGTAIGDLTDPCIPFIIGCTDPSMFNYNEEANFDLEGFLCTPFIYGCTDPTAYNYDEYANTENDSCEEFVYGCTDDTQFNYNALANTDNGSCIEIVEGCTDEESFNYNILANTDDASCIAVLLGCTDPTALNYNDLANTDDESCIPYIFGCTDSSAFNYNADANTDDASCVPIIEGCTDSTQFNYNPDANVSTDTCIEFVYGCTDTTAWNYDELANTNVGCISFVYGCTDPEAFNYDLNANTDDESCIPVVIGCMDDTALNYDINANTNNGCIPYLYGCTDEEAFNYDSEANTDDGSCTPLLYGCTDGTAFNYNENANTDNGSCIEFIYGCTDDTMFNYDALANTDNGTCEPFVYGCMDSSALNYNEEANVEDGSCIPFIYGCTDSTAWNYDVDANTDNGTCEPFIYGCTNTLAVNYDETANTDDGSCILTVYGCTDPTALNYNPDANIDNDSCIEIVEGCTDPAAFNYNANANVEDFSCIDVVIGCTDENAINYDPLANTDSGGCIDVLTGCTDINAFNYSLTANTDDGSCVYDAGCSGGPGEPYWLPNECFAWVISIDDECCLGEWDSYCVELYNYCDLGWPVDLEEIDSELIIYPNPVTDILNISKEINIKVYDMVGNLVISKEKTTKIDMTNLPKGIYNLNISYNNKNINNRIIKQ
jgi:hypothetical protein